MTKGNAYQANSRSTVRAFVISDRSGGTAPLNIEAAFFSFPSVHWKLSAGLPFRVAGLPWSSYPFGTSASAAIASTSSFEKRGPVGSPKLRKDKSLRLWQLEQTSL